MSSTHARLYSQARAAGWPAYQAWQMALVRERWDAAEARGLVRLRVEMDDSFEPYGETARERAEVAAEAEREGVWGQLGQAKCACCGHWKTVDSVWGIVGQVLPWSGYDTDIMDATLTWLEENHGR